MAGSSVTERETRELQRKSNFFSFMNTVILHKRFAFDLNP